MADKHDHETTITVNSRPKQVTSKELTFEQVLGLAFDPVPTGDNWEFTVGYRRGDGKKPAGTLSAGETLKVKDGMIIDVTATDKS